MNKLVLGLGIAALALTVASPSFANEVHKKRNVKEVVGYVQTESVINQRDALFHKTDTSGDGAINFKEFQRAAMFDNNYAMFKMNDTNNDDLLTIDEFRVFSKSGPARVSYGPAHTNYNFNKTPINK